MIQSKKIIKITGGGSGIGKAIALKYAKHGHIVCISGRNLDKLHEVQQEAENFTGKIHIFAEDVTNIEQVNFVYKTICDTIGLPNMVFLNAGYSVHAPIKKFDINVYREVCDINYMGVVNGLSPVLQDMMARKSGHILITGSVAGYRGLPMATPYCATKAAVNNLTEGLTTEAKEYNIKVQLICPGFIKTPMTDKNKFPMPFMTTATKIADYIYLKAETNCHEIIYPRFFGYIMRFYRLLPNSIIQYLQSKMLKAK
jgi:short-subunit dehydrogenase